MYDSSTSQVKYRNRLSDVFSLDEGLAQGAVLSPILYSLFIDDVVAMLQKVVPDDCFMCYGKKLHTLLFADDIIMLAKSPLHLQMMLDALYDYACQWRFDINIKKSYVVPIVHLQSRRSHSGHHIDDDLSWCYHA